MKINVTFREVAGAALLVAGLTGAAYYAGSSLTVETAKNITAVPEHMAQSVAQTLKTERAQNVLQHGSHEWVAVNAGQLATTLTVANPSSDDVLVRYNKNQADIAQARFTLAFMSFLVGAMFGTPLLKEGRNARKAKAQTPSTPKVA